MIALIDYGAGNLHSVDNALRWLGCNPAITADPGAVRRAERIILPGVGAFGACASALRAIPGMVEALEERVIGDGVPFLGICVGMQLMATRGLEHGEHAGLGWIDGEVAAIPAERGRVPHMGWNDVVQIADHPVLETGEAYFLHGFAFTGSNVLATTDHGGPLVAAIGRDNLLGVQFHPEKSQGYGLAVLARFTLWNPGPPRR